jgi:hypothetical protein
MSNLDGQPTAAALRNHYALRAHDHSLRTAFGLLMQSLPYALMRFAVEFGFAVAGIIWLLVTFGGSAWLGTHVASAFGVVWLIGCLVGVGWFWGTVLRYFMHLIACGHVAVLTELITKGSVGNGSEDMFAYGRRIVTERFGQVNLLFGLNALVRGVLQTFHGTLDWISQTLPIPGLDSAASLVNLVMRAATRYLDKVIFSYILARNDGDPGRDAREGIIYYCQNAREILKTSIWMVVQEKVLTVILWVVMMIPAALITMVMPHSIRESAGFVTVVIAVFMTAAVRSSFLKPLFLIVMMIRYHSLIENQPINAEWDHYLAGISDQFRALGQDLQRFRSPSPQQPAAPPA